MIDSIFYTGVAVVIALMIIWAGMTILDKVREKDEILTVLCMTILMLGGVVVGTVIGINLAM